MVAKRSTLWMRRALALALVSTFLFSAAGQVSAAGIVRYAKPLGRSSGTCSTWAAACTLARAWAVALPGDRLWVAQGTYLPTTATTPANPRTKTFKLKSGVQVYGGFAGTETRLSQRNPALNVTTLSGDIGAPGDASDNAYHVVTAIGIASTAVLDGFIITAGNADGPASGRHARGGGMYSEFASPRLRNLVFSANTATYGGGLYNHTSSSQLTNVTFNGNSAAYGAGLYNYAGRPRLTNVTFSANTAAGATDSTGGGMYNHSSSPALSQVTFSGNTAAYYGGGMYIYNGSPRLTNVTFSNNSANYGGGMANQGSSPTLTDVSFSSNSAVIYGAGMYNNSSSPALTNVTFNGNTTPNSGGGMYNDATNSPTLTNVTFSANSAGDSGGGLYNEGGSSPVLANVTFSGNSASNIGGGLYNEGGSSPKLANSIIANSTSGGDCIGSLDAASSNNLISDAANACGLTNGANGNIVGSDPKLEPLQDNGGFTQTHALGVGSPAIDAGSAASCAPKDQRGITRPQGAACDIGAYEHVVASVLYATPGGLTSGWCDRWADACELSYALPLAVSGQQIWAAAGTYKPTSGTDRVASFALKDGVAIYGGFAGGETLLTQRSPALNVTILSGEIGAAGTADNSYHVVTAIDLASSAVLDGFTITAGNANGVPPNRSGGGMFNDSSSPTLANLTFHGSTAADYGGGMYNYDGSHPVLTNATFSSNTAYGGGGMCNHTGSNAELTNVTFSGNSADNGGGMANYTGSGSILTNVAFSGNSATAKGGGIYSNGSSPTLTDVTFGSNTARDGAGLANLSSSPTLTNVTFTGNSASFSGGGLYNWNSGPTLTNVTFSGNSATNNGGGMYSYSSSPVLVTNATFHGNTAGYGGGMFSDISSITLTNNIIANSSGGDCGGGLSGTSSNNLIADASNACGLTNGVYGNIVGSDPLLGPLQDNGGFTQTHALGAGSPAIDAGNVTACAASDQRGYRRPQDGNADSKRICDMGAYEALPTAQLKSIAAQDGWVRETAESTGVGGTFNGASPTFLLGDDATRRQYRAVLSFQTGSRLPDNAVVVSARLTLVRESVVPDGSDPFDLLQGLMIDVRKGFFGTGPALEAKDFQTAGHRLAGPFSPGAGETTYVFDLPAAANASINKLGTNGGLTQLRLRFQLDDDNDAEPDSISFYSGNTATVAYRPVLTIEYYLP